MTQVGQAYKGIWPEHPIKDPRLGQTVRYPRAGSNGTITRGTIEHICIKYSSSVVYFTDGNWCYASEVSEDRD